MQELLLWQQVIEQDISRHSDIADGSAARQLAEHASQAYATMQSCRIPVDALKWQGTESEALGRWIQRLLNTLQTPAFGQRTLNAHVTSELLDQVSQITIEHLILDGFEILSPEQSQFLAALQQNGTNIYRIEIPASLSEPIGTALDDEREECAWVAHRCRSLLAEQPQQRIGIVVDAQTDRSLLLRELDKALLPDSSITLRRGTTSVSTQGSPLKQAPLISQLLHILSLNAARPIAFEAFTILLFCPWLTGYTQERFARSRLDAEIRQKQQRHIRIRRLKFLKAAQETPALLSLAESLAAFSALKSKRLPMHQWIRHIQELLNALGLSQYMLQNDPKPDNDEIRQVNGFRDALLSLTAAETIVPSIDWQDAFGLLQQACSQARLAAIPVYPNIAIVSREQSTGSHWDVLLLMQMHEHSFPPAPETPALLSPTLRRQYRVPMSLSEDCTAHAHWLWQQWLRHADHIEACYARQVSDQSMLASPILRGIVMQSWHSNKQPEVCEMESFVDAPDVPLPAADEPSDIRGGTAIITHQSICPFRAFAAHRLQLAPLEEAEPGLDARDKGKLIHAVLEHIWQQLKTRKALAELDVSQRSELIDKAIADAWRDLHADADAHTRHIESRRLQSLIEIWLTQELERPEFRVESTEEKHTAILPLHGDRRFSMHFTIDRMDRDISDRRILIDYKTGQRQSVTHWLQERMREPQLPLYAVARQLSGHDAVSFAHLQRGENMGFHGLAGEDAGIKGIRVCDGKHGRPDDWDELLTQWQASIEQLATEFAQGTCRAEPLDKQACRNCGLEAVCRIGESGWLEQNETQETE